MTPELKGAIEGEANVGIEIRRARAADAIAIHKLEELFPGDRMSLRSVRALLRSPAAHTWVAERTDRILGNLILLSPKRHRRARIYSVVVAPEARGHGLAARLVGAAEQWARADSRIGLSLEVRSDNTAARRLYAKLGFVESEALPAFYEDGADGVRLRKDWC